MHELFVLLPESLIWASEQFDFEPLL